MIMKLMEFLENPNFYKGGATVKLERDGEDAYICFIGEDDEKYILLDGRFTLAELKAIIEYADKYSF